MADNQGPIPNPFGAPNSGGSTDGLQLIRELMAKQKANGKQAKVNVGDTENRLDNMSMKTFDGVSSGIKDRIEQLKALIERGHKTGKSETEMDRMVQQLAQALNAANILKDKADQRVNNAGNTAQAGNWAIAGNKLEEFIEKAIRSAVRGGAGPGFKSPRQPREPGEGGGRRGRGGGGSGRRERDPDVIALMKELGSFRKVADSFIAGQKGFTGNPYSLTQTKDQKDQMASVFSRFMEEKRGSLNEEDENALLSKFNYAIRRFEIAIREGEKGDRANSTNVGGAFSTALGTFGLGQILNKVLFNDPMQYRTMPALQAMATTGPMGEALSAALGARAQYQNNVNQSAFNGGLGLVGAGLGGMMLSRTAAGAKLGMGGGKFGKAGIGLAALGAATSVLGATGGASGIWDALSGKVGGVTSDEVFSTQLATQFNKPDVLIQRNDLMKNVMRSYGSLGSWNGPGDSFGHYTDADSVKNSKTRTGNALLDRLSATPYMGADFQKLGLTGDALGEIMVGLGGSIRGKKGAQAESLTRFAAGYGTAFGADPSTIIDMMATAQAAGGNNLQSMVKNNMAAASDKNGQLDQFAVNVIAPAVGRVTQSLALKNVSQNAEKLNEQVSALYREFSVGKLSDSNLGKVIANNPEMLGELLGNFGAGAQQQAGTDVGFYQMMRMGLDPTEYARGAGSSPEKMKEFIEKSYAYFDIGNNMESDGKGGKRMNWNMFNAIAQIGEQYGFKRQELEQLYIAADKNGGNLDIGDASRLSRASSSVDKNAANNLSAITSTTLQNAQANLTTQQDMFTATVGSISGKILEAQDIMQKYITDPDIIARATQGIQNLINEMNRQIGSLNKISGPRGSAEESRSAVQSYLQAMKPEERKVAKELIAGQKIDWMDTKNGGAQRADAYITRFAAQIEDKIRQRTGQPTQTYTHPMQQATGEYGVTWNSFVQNGRSLTNFNSMDANYAAYQKAADGSSTDGKDVNLQSIKGVQALFKEKTVTDQTLGNWMSGNGPALNEIIDKVMLKIDQAPNSELSAAGKKAAKNTLAGIRKTLQDPKTSAGQKQSAQLELLTMFGFGGGQYAGALKDGMYAGMESYRKKEADLLAEREYQQLTQGAAYSRFNRNKESNEGNFAMAMDGEGYTVNVKIKKGMSAQELKNAISQAIYNYDESRR